MRLSKMFYEVISTTDITWCNYLVWYLNVSRRVTLYWKPLKRNEENGDGFRYIVVELNQNANNRNAGEMNKHGETLYRGSFDLVRVHTS